MAEAMGDRDVQNEKEGFFTYFLSRLSPAFRIGLVFLLVYSIHVLKVARMFPLESLSVSSNIMAVNYGLEFSDVLRDRAFLRQSNVDGGYDPFHGAGYLSSPTSSERSHFPVRMDRLMRKALTSSQSLYVTFVTCCLLCPILLYFACRFFGGSRPSSLLAMALGVAAFANRDFFSSHVPWKQVMFIFSSYLAVFCLGLYYKALQEKNGFTLPAFFITLSLLLNLTPLFLLLLIFPIAVLFVKRWGSLNWGARLLAPISVFLAILLSWKWVMPIPWPWPAPHNSAVLTPVAIGLFILSAFMGGLWVSKEENKELAWTLSLWALFFFFFFWMMGRFFNLF